MQANKIADVTQVSLEELKEIGATPGPCISIMMPVSEGPGQKNANPLRLKQAVDGVGRTLEERGIEREQSREIMESLNALQQDLAFEGKGLAIFCAPGICRAYHVPAGLNEEVHVNDHFYIRPLLSSVHTDRRFYILALSQKHIRLLRCTEHTSEEVALPASAPKTLWDDKQSDQPDHNQSDSGTAASSTGGMRGVTSTTNTDSEAHLEYLAHFYKHVSEGVNALLHEGKDPVVIAGVDYETAAFRRVNVYPHLVEDSVHGAADGLKGGELHKRALEAVRGYFEAPLRTALARFEEFGEARSSSKLKDIVKAACEGRVLEVVIAEGAQYMGNFNEATFDVKSHKQAEPGDEDLLNMTALQTLLHGGSVFVVPGNRVPHGAPAVAVFRW